MRIYEEAKCRKGLVHNFVKSRSLPDALIEVCTLCSEKIILNKGEDGRIDNVRYARAHQRDTIQPFGLNRELFERIYGHEGAMALNRELRSKKSKQQIQREWEDTRREVVKKAKRSKFY